MPAIPPPAALPIRHAAPAAHPSFCSKLSQKIGELFRKILEPLAGYLLKICFFQSVPTTDRFSRWIMGPVARGIMNLWQKTQGINSARSSFDSTRLEKSRSFLNEFAEWKVTRTADGVEIKWGLFRAAKFNQWLVENGGVRDGEWIRPQNEADWPRLQRLGEFKWFEQVGHAFRVPALVPGAENTCVLRCQGFGRKMPMDKAFIGLHLAAGFNYALFDWREDFMNGGVFNDSEAVYQALLQEGFAAQQIKAMASCRSTFAASRLKEMHHAEGLDAVLIHPPPSLKDVVANQMWPANKIGLYGVPVIEKTGYFDTVRRIREMPPGPGRLCIVISEGDKTLPQNTAGRIEEAARLANCPFQLIYERLRADGPDPHFSEPLKNPAVLEPYLNFLAGR